MVQKPHTEHCPSLFNEGFLKKHWSIGVFPSMDQRAAAHFVYCCCPCKSGILSVFAYCSWPCKVGILFINYKNLKALKSLVAPRTVPQSSFNRAFGRHFLLRVRGPHHLNFQGAPSKIWRVPPLKYITNSPILGGSLGPQAKFCKGPIGFSGDRDPYLPPPSPESPASMPPVPRRQSHWRPYHFFMTYSHLWVIPAPPSTCHKSTNNKSTNTYRPFTAQSSRPPDMAGGLLNSVTDHRCF